MTLFLALLPIIWLIVGFVLLKLPGHICCSIGLAVTIIVAMIGSWHMSIGNAAWATLEGAANAIWPICIIVIAAIFVYNLTVKSGGMEIIKTNLASVSADRRIQVLIVAWGFGGFLEGVSGFGTSVAIPAAILVGLGFAPIEACIVCLLSNAPVAVFGAIGIPTITAANATGLDLFQLSADTVLQLAVLIVVCPIFMVRVVGKLKGVWGITLASGISFAVPAYLLARFAGPELTTLIGGVVSMAVTILLAKFTHKSVDPEYEMDGVEDARLKMKGISKGHMLQAWAPFGLVFVILFFTSSIFPAINGWLTNTFKSGIVLYPGTKPTTFKWINNPGVLIIIAGIIGGFVQKTSAKDMGRVFLGSIKQMLKSIITIVTIIAISTVMTRSGMIADIAAALAATGSVYPIFAPIIGGIGTFITGSVTSACALFSDLQNQTAAALGFNQSWLVAANGAGATVGKIISPQSIAMATAATGCVGSDGIIIRKAVIYCVIFLAFLAAVSFLGVIL